MKGKIILLAVVIVFGGIYAIKQARTIGFNENYQPDQPIQFSHKIHAGENQIQCLYCHFAADKGRHAGIPPTELCLNCHKLIRKDSPEIKKITNALRNKENIFWNKVHHFPDFAYFNHAQHVNVAGISCQKCHGVVEGMTRMKQEKPLAMGWCIDCHRDNKIAPPNDHKSMTGGDCAKCHY